MKFVAIACSLVTLAGCTAASDAGSASDTAALGAGSATARLDGCVADAAAKNVTSIALNGWAVNFPAQAPLAGVHVCVEARDGSDHRCTDTDAAGKVSIPITPCQDIRVTYEADGYISVNQLNRVTTVDVPVGTRMLTPLQREHMATALGTTVDTSKALPIITTWTASHQPLADVSVSMSPTSGTRWYLSTAGSVSSSLSATTSFGIMGFYNVDPGPTTEVTATAPGLSCTTYFSVPGSTSNSAIVEEIAGFIGEALFACQ